MFIWKVVGAFCNMALEWIDIHQASNQLEMDNTIGEKFQMTNSVVSWGLKMVCLNEYIYVQGISNSEERDMGQKQEVSISVATKTQFSAKTLCWVFMKNRAFAS